MPASSRAWSKAATCSVRASRYAAPPPDGCSSGVAIDELKDVKLTAQWEQSLADIEHGRGDETVFLTEIRTACAAMPGRVMEMTQRDSLRQLAQQAGRT